MQNQKILDFITNKDKQIESISLGMTFPSEQQYCQLYAAEEYTGLGEMVDLGCWLGAETIALAKGLIQNKNCQQKNRRIHSFDCFIWQEYMNEQITIKDNHNTYRIRKYLDGESFLDTFEELTKSYSDYINIYPGDLCQIDWIDKPIEFLFIDAMKSWNLASGVCQKFFPYLIPQKSIIIHQDFCHFFTPWIHLINYRLRDYFEILYYIPNSSSVVFKYQKAIPQEQLNFDYSFNSFTIDEAEAAFKYSFESIPKSKHSAIAAARVMFFAHQEQYRKAKLEFNHYLKEGYKLDKNLELARRFIISKKFNLTTNRELSD